MGIVTICVMTPGRRIRQAMDRRGWKIVELARKLGISAPNVSAIIADERPGLKHYPKLARLLGVTVEWITTGHPKQPWEAAVVNHSVPAAAILWDKLADPSTREMFFRETGETPAIIDAILVNPDRWPSDDQRVRRWARSLDLDEHEHDLFVATAQLQAAPPELRKVFEAMQQVGSLGPMAAEESTKAKADEDKLYLPVTVREQGTVYIAAPPDGEDTERPPFTEQEGTLPLVGTVAAGSQLISYLNEPRAFRWRSSWAIMRVEGTSAYPVVYPNQFVVVDTDRPVRHNNLVIVETEEPDGFGKLRMNAYLKRYCRDLNAPDGFVLASVNSGLDSPYIPKDRILVIAPIVGVLFEEGSETGEWKPVNRFSRRRDSDLDDPEARALQEQLDREAIRENAESAPPPSSKPLP